MKGVALNPDMQKKRLRWILLVFFITLSLPVYYLLRTVYTQLENEAYFTSRHQAENLVNQVELNLKRLLDTEQNRPIAEYQFFNVMANPLLSESAGVKFSPLSEIPPKTDIKGLIGYFQINTDGSFHVPALPEVGQDNLSGLSLAELESRIGLKKKIRSLLSINLAETKTISNTVSSRPVKYKAEAEAVDNKLPYIEEFEQKTFAMKTDSTSTKKNKAVKKQAVESYYERGRALKEFSEQKPAKIVQKLRTRKETVQIPDQAMASSYFNRSQQQSVATAITAKDQLLELDDKASIAAPTSIINVLSFESEVTPLQLLLIGQEYFCFYRYVWHDNKRYTQGFLVNRDEFLAAVIEPLVESSAFASLLFSNQDGLMQKIAIKLTEHEFDLYKRQLAMPFQKIALSVNAAKLASVPGSLLIDLLALSLFIIFFIGFIAFYRLGSKQIELSKQQQNFIAAVSHELKTPLTSIRMYGEMLRSGWVADDVKKQNYYDFIFFESERLSRLIANVLQLARLGHQQAKSELVKVSAQSLLKRIASRVEVQIEASSFNLNIIPSIAIEDSVYIKVDEDAFFQIIINLVDNAIKFANKAENKQIDIGFSVEKNKKHIVFFIRDYGTGINNSQLKKIFTLFYRSEDELTRATPGTGIGLALVMQLAETMQASCAVINKHPGAEFQIKFPVA